MNTSLPIERSLKPEMPYADLAAMKIILMHLVAREIGRSAREHGSRTSAEACDRFIGGCEALVATAQINVGTGDPEQIRNEILAATAEMLSVMRRSVTTDKSKLI